jgi:hypothetical protein
MATWTRGAYRSARWRSCRRALSGWQVLGRHGSLLTMTSSPNPYHGFRFPAAIIEQAIWLYHCFSLSLRDVEMILAARGVVVTDASDPPRGTDGHCATLPLG